MTDRLPKGADKRPEVVGVLEAPILYFDGVSNQGFNAGCVNIVLVAAKHIPRQDGGIDAILSAVADLRCSIQGALNLKKAIDDALLLATPIEGAKN